MSGSWFKDKDMTTNYVEHGVIKPYNESTYKDDEFIHCTLKVIHTIFGAPEGASYIYVYEKDRENNSNTGGD
jgi:hypothetical protein